MEINMQGTKAPPNMSRTTPFAKSVLCDALEVSSYFIHHVNSAPPLTRSLVVPWANPFNSLERSSFKSVPVQSKDSNQEQQLETVYAAPAMSLLLHAVQAEYQYSGLPISTVIISIHERGRY
jgi:hypothetical protein